VIYGFAKECGLPASEAEELVRRVVENAPTHVARDDPAKLSEQLRAVAQRLISERLTQAQHSAASAVAEGVAIPCQAFDPALERVWDRDWQRNRLQSCLEQIRHEMDSVAFGAFQFHALEGWTATATAEFLQIDEGTVYLAKSRALRRMRELMGGELKWDERTWMRRSRTST
jgi:DNA-directed RNA polymerase specialized sigma24 family protein